MGSSEITGSIKVATGALTNCGVAGARWDVGEGLTVWYSLDGAAEQRALCFAPHTTCGGAPATSKSPLGLDNNCDGNGDNGLLSDVLTAYQFTIPAGGSSLDLRIQMTADQGGEAIAFDDIQLAAVILSPTRNTPRFRRPGHWQKRAVELEHCTGSQ